MNCAIAEQIAVMANEEDDRTVSECLFALIREDRALINGEMVSLYQITDSIDGELMREAMQEHVCGDSLAVYNLYIKALEDFINE